MATVRYTPTGHSGYTCEIESLGGAGLRIARAALCDELQVGGDPAMTSNESLVERLDAYAANELASRRARRPERKKAFTKAANAHRKVATNLADLIDDVEAHGEQAWCSGCLERHEQRWVRRPSLTPDAYLCAGCGAATTPCLWPKCRHYALRKPGYVQGGKYCAEHLHVIPGFDKLDAHLSSLDDYGGWLEFDAKHARKYTMLAGGALGGGLVVAPLFFLAAPAVGGAIGAWGGLSGAAATSHGLATLGFGSIAAGGLGMTGGTAVVTAIGGGLGTAMGASVSAAYAGDDPSFAIELIEDGSGPTVLFSTGFLTENEDGWGEWEPLVRTRYPVAKVYRVRWGSKEQRNLRALFAREAGGKALVAGAGRAALHATRTAVRRLGPIGGASLVAEVAKNPFWVARARANMTGAVLADLIVRTPETDYVLMGHSLGARVMLTTAESLGSRESEPRLQSVHLLGAATNAGHDLTQVAASVSDQVWNYWSTNDGVLKGLYTSAQLGQKAAGATGFDHVPTKVKNRNVSRQVGGHSEYVPSIKLR